MRQLKQLSRSGFTLLELMLALGIGLLLLGGLYIAVDTQLRMSQSGRDLMEQSTLARSLLDRMANDISSSATLSDPGRFRRANQGNAASTTPSTTSTDDTETDADAEAEATDMVNELPVNLILPLGVKGESTQMHLYVTRVPREVFLTRRTDDQLAEGAPVSDIRRISYWLAGDLDVPLGLARQEVTLATTDEAINLILPDFENESPFVIAPEVKSLTFEYFDGTGWLESWDSTLPGADGVTPIGPPRAIAITISLLRPGFTEDSPPEVALRQYRHVVAIVTANGIPQETLDPEALLLP